MKQVLSDAAGAFAGNARNAGLRRAQAAFALLGASEWAFTVALSVVAFEAGGASAVGVVAAVRMLPAALLAPIGATLADRHPRDRILALAAVARAVAVGAAAGLVAAGAPVAWTYAAAVAATAVFVVVRPAHSALLPSLCHTPRELTGATVVRGLMDSAGILGGPAVAAALLAWTSAEATLAAIAVLSLAAAVLVLRIRYERPGLGDASRPHVLQELREGVAALAGHRDAQVILGLGVVQTFVRGAFSVLTVVMAIDLLGMGDPGVGVLSAAVGVGAVLGSFGASLLTGGGALARWEGVGVALWGVPLIACAVWPADVPVLVFLAFLGVGNALIDVGVFTVSMRMLPDAVLGRVFGLLESLVALTIAAGSLVAPLVVSALGVRGALVAIGAVAPVLVALAWPRLRRIDGEVGARDEEIDVLRQVPVLRPLPLPIIERLARHAEHEVIPAGTTVFEQGDPGDAYYVIAGGRVEVVQDGRLLRTLGAGEGFGEIALLRSCARTAGVRAQEPTTVHRVRRADFLPAVTGHRQAAAEATATVERLLAGAPTSPSGPPSRPAAR